MMEYTKPVFVQFLKSDSKLIRLNFGLTIMKMYRCLLNGISKSSPFYNCHGRIESNIAYSLTRIYLYQTVSLALHWRHSDHDGVSNHQLHDYLLNRLFGRRSKKASKPRVTVLCVGNSPGPVNSPHKGPVTRKMFPFDDVIMRQNGH